MLAREIGQYKESADTYAGLRNMSPRLKQTGKWNCGAPEETGASSISLPTVDFESLLPRGRMSRRGWSFPARSFSTRWPRARITATT